MLESRRDVAIVGSSIVLGRNIGLEVIAEGLETVEQWGRLRAHSCA